MVTAFLGEGSDAFFGRGAKAVSVRLHCQNASVLGRHNRLAMDLASDSCSEATLSH